MSNDYDKARSKAEQSFNSGMLDSNDKLTSAEKKVYDANEAITTLKGEISDLKKLLQTAEHDAAMQFVLDVDDGVRKQYKKL